MPGTIPSRVLGHFAYDEVASSLRKSSVLCMPMGSIEQHGLHLPLNTDCVIAEALTRRIIARWGGEHDLWELPLVPIGLSREHAWAPGTLSLSIGGISAYLRDLGGEIARSLPARNLLIVNGHGGNRGILDALMQELRTDFGVNVATLHLGPLMSPDTGAALPEIHAGRDETSLMLALAPALVRREKLATLTPSPGGEDVRALVLDPAASYPWTSDDPRLASAGLMGDARGASAEEGEAIAARVAERSGAVIARLASNAARTRP